MSGVVVRVMDEVVEYKYINNNTLTVLSWDTLQTEVRTIFPIRHRL